MRLLTFSLLFAFSGALLAGPLMGFGQLPMPSTTGATPPGIAPTINVTTGPFTGTWSSNVQTAWQGTFSGTASYPCCGNAGTTSWTFGGLTNSGGWLPSTTLFRLGDVDNGEVMTLTAYNQAGEIITAPWLDVPSFVSSPNPLDIQQANLPDWVFASGVYTFTGRAGVNGNTLLTVALPSNQAIFRLEVGQQSSNSGFTLAAPEVPEPGTYALMGASLGALAMYKRRRKS